MPGAMFIPSPVTTFGALVLQQPASDGFPAWMEAPSDQLTLGLTSMNRSSPFFKQSMHRLCT